MLFSLLNFGFLLLSGTVFLIGLKFLKFFPNIKKLNLPVPVIGAFVFLPFLRITEYLLGIELKIPGELRDALLVIFFCTMGLAVQFKATIKGGKPLVMICLLSFALVVLQNVLSVLIMIFFGNHPAYGLLAGSISYVGGFGSSLAWGSHYSEQGLKLALEIGFACSTFGLIFGGLFAGPAVAWLLKRKDIKIPNVHLGQNGVLLTEELEEIKSCGYANGTLAVLKVLIAIGVSVYLGDLLQPILKSVGIDLPRFLTAMLVAIFLTNSLLRKSLSLPAKAIDNVSDLSFNTFIILSLIGMAVSGLSEYLFPILIILVFQIILTVFFSTEIIFRVMGKDYNAAVLSGGVIGFGLSSVAVAMATVKTVVHNYGPAPRAILLTSLVGAALIDLPNNLLIGILTKLEFFQVGTP